MVSRNPTEVWSVNAVPTPCWGATSVTIALNCAESATTNRPHTSTTGSNIQKLCPEQETRGQ